MKDALVKINKNVTDGDIVLLSPGSASWDQYAKFEDRGEEFKNIVKEYKMGEIKIENEYIQKVVRSY